MPLECGARRLSRRVPSNPTTPPSSRPYRRAQIGRRGGAVPTNDYGAQWRRASNECSVWKRNLVITTTRPATSKAHDYTVRRDRRRALWITMPPCAS
eukprot:3784691-Pleurochrysis_carterae.AAC.3